MEGVLNQRYHGHHGGQDGHCIIMTMMQTIAIHSHTYHCFCPMFILFFMRIDSPATCMNHLAAFHRAQSAQPDAGSVLLSQRATSFSRDHLHIHTQYMSSSSWLAYLSRELSSGSANYRAPRKGIRIDKTQPYEAEDPPLPNGTGTRLHQYLRYLDTKLSIGRTRARTKNTQHVSTCCSPTSKSPCPLLLRDRPCASPDLQDDFCILCRAVHSASSPPNRSAKSPQTTPAERIDEIETLLEDESRRRRRRCSTYHPAEFRILLCLARTDQIPLSRLQLHASPLTLDGAIGEQFDHLLSRRLVRAVCADVEFHRREI